MRERVCMLFHFISSCDIASFLLRFIYDTGAGGGGGGGSAEFVMNMRLLLLLLLPLNA